MEEFDIDIPVLQGEVIGDQVRVWCKYCKKYHIHGWPNPTTNITHRVAHCINKNSPYNETGYSIEVKSNG